MNSAKVKAYAKINLSIDVTEKRPDGYHNIKSVMQSVSLFDEISLVKSGEGIRLTTSLPFLPCDHRNIAYKAAMLFYEKTNLKPGIKITIQKNIPVGGGLGGGSADAAAVLVFLNKMYGSPLPETKLFELGKTCGADVPFCMTGGTCLAEGIGEKITKLAPMPDCHILLVKPQFSISTKTVFEAFDLRKTVCRPDTYGIINALKRGDLNEVAVRMYNMLEMVTQKTYAELTLYKNILRDNSALGTVMSGSGSTIFAIFKTKQNVLSAKNAFSDLPVITFAVKPVNNIFV